MPLLGNLQNPAWRTLIFQAVLNPTITPAQGTDPDEGDLFSTGIHVLEQHTSLLRAVEARIQQYTDFLTLCSTALTNVQNYLPQAQSRLTQLENDLAQARQDVAFTTTLLNDETARVNSVNAQRAYTLANYVPSVVYTRPRTLQTADGQCSQPATRARQYRGEPRAKLPAAIRGHTVRVAGDRFFPAPRRAGDQQQRRFAQMRSAAFLPVPAVRA